MFSVQFPHPVFTGVMKIYCLQNRVAITHGPRLDRPSLCMRPAPSLPIKTYTTPVPTFVKKGAIFQR